MENHALVFERQSLELGTFFYGPPAIAHLVLAHMPYAIHSIWCGIANALVSVTYVDHSKTA